MKRIRLVRCVLLMALMVGPMACAEIEGSLTPTPAATPAESPAPETPQPAAASTATPTATVGLTATPEATLTPTLGPTVAPETTVTPSRDGHCTRSQGYWRTHSRYGPEPRDPTWNRISPEGEDTLFYRSGQTWYQVLETPPAGGNEYYILANQYIAARLNHLSGASSTAEVDAALDWAAGYFESEAPQGPQQGPPQDAPPGPGRNGLRDEALARAELLDSYNSGRVGPGPCRD
jgi:hypothetical protein